MYLLIVLILVYITRPCLANIIENSKHDESSYLVEATLEVLTSCYGNEVNVICFAGNSGGSLIKTLQSSIPISVTLLDRTRRIVRHDLVQREYRSKLQVSVVTASSSTELEKILRVLKNSVWWNHMASISILVWPSISEDRCSKAFEMLFVAWKMNLLNTKLICLNITKEILVYTYNPYIDVAPDSWEVENTYRGENDHLWTLFVRKYQKDKKICKELDFDKTKDLGGFETRSTVKNLENETTIDLNKCGTERSGLLAVAIPKTIFCALNGTLKLFMHNHSKIISFMDENGRDIMMSVVEGSSDILLNVRYNVAKKDVTTTYPCIYTGLSAITQYSGQVSPLSKIRAVVDSSSGYGIFLVIVITLLFFILVLQQSIVSAMLNTFRIICNGSVPIVLTNLASRFYLGCLFLFVITIQALYQGKLAALLTKPVPLHKVNTMQDLIDGNHKVYAYKTVADFFRTPAFEGRYFKMEKVTCVENVLHDPSVACVIDYARAIKTATPLNLYVSTDLIIKSTMSYVIRDDWPLESRVNKILATLFETNIIWYWHGRKLDYILELRKFYEKQEESQQFRIITLDELLFVFVILGIGLSCATVCFIVEVGIDKIRSKMTNVRSYFRN